jgi:CRP/FNR family nitrogen fixation transcriptional regulator
MLQGHSAIIGLKRPPAASGPHIADQTFAEASRFQDVPARIIARHCNIYDEGDAAGHVYKVLAGAVCTYKILVDGRRQVASFYLPGDAFGLERRDTQPFAAVAIAGAAIVSMKKSSVLDLAENDPNAGKELTAWAMTELFRAQRHLLMLSRTAPARLAAFLLEMAERLRTGRELELPMGRRDIADYLGLTVETIARIFTQFQQTGVIELQSSRRIGLRNIDYLTALSE